MDGHETLILGYRVKTTDGWYVTSLVTVRRSKKQTNYFARMEKTKPTSRADAYRLAAEWLDSGYLPKIVKVTRKCSKLANAS